MSITIIAAVSNNGVIGNSKMKKLPWICPEELRFFREQTIGKTIVMGRKTAEEVGALPDRERIVLSKDKNYQLEGFTTMTLDEFLALNEKNMNTQYLVCGGAEIYNAVMPYASLARISYLDFEAYGDILLPILSHLNWKKICTTEMKKFVAVDYISTNRVTYSKILSNELLNNKTKEKSL